MHRFRTLAEVRCRGPVPRIADFRRDEHIVRDVLEAVLTISAAMIARDWMWECPRGSRPLAATTDANFPMSERVARSAGSTEPARASIDQPLQLNWCNVPESPCHWRSFGSDHRLPLLLAKSMLAN
jgi:hypothetical protein